MSRLVRDANSVPVQAIKQGVVQVVAYTTHAESAAFAGTTTLIRIVATTACHYLLGSNPTATVANGSYLPANVIEVVGVQPGDKISVIQVSSGGNLHITEAAA